MRSDAGSASSTALPPGATAAAGRDITSGAGARAGPASRTALAPESSSKARRQSADLAAGHRDRLRDRFDRGEALPDYELLELLLFRSIPRRDTKPIAKALIAEFGSFAAVVSAPAARLLEVSGVGERVVGDFRLVRATAERLTHDTLKARAVLGSTDAVVEFYRAKLRGVAREEFHVLYLDKKNQMLASECAGTGTVDHTPVYPREVLKRALELSASAVVLIHNHPSGDPSPSRADIAVTAKIMEAAQPLGLSVHDHIIIGANAFTSLRGEGYV
ncbi:RadC family protein [Acuticoccus yangtzensis]|uniref:RadC family protein n=1 Tax=Acuticoccus yangtzensis TaxID=1443441 RepID=UPI003CCBB583